MSHDYKNDQSNTREEKLKMSESKPKKSKKNRAKRKMSHDYKTCKVDTDYILNLPCRNDPEYRWLTDDFVAFIAGFLRHQMGGCLCGSRLKPYYGKLVYQFPWGDILVYVREDGVIISQYIDCADEFTDRFINLSRQISNKIPPLTYLTSEERAIKQIIE